MEDKNLKQEESQSQQKSNVNKEIPVTIEDSSQSTSEAAAAQTPTSSTTEASVHRKAQGPTGAINVGIGVNVNENNDQAIERALKAERPHFSNADGGVVSCETFGTRVLPLGTYLFMEEKWADQDMLVSVPASIETRMILDHFESRVMNDIDDVQYRIYESVYSMKQKFQDATSAMHTLSQDILMEVINYLAKFKDYVGLAYSENSSVDDVDGSLSLSSMRDNQVYVLGKSAGTLRTLLSEAGFSDEEIASVIKNALDSLDRYFIRNTFNPAVMRYSLETELADQVDFNSLADAVEISRVESSIRALQELYSFAATTSALDSVSNRIVTGNSSAHTLSSVVALRNMFARYPGPVTVQRLNKVVSSSLASMKFDVPDYERQGGQLLHANLSNIAKVFEDMNDSVNRLQLMRFYLAALAFYSNHFKSIKDAYTALCKLDPVSELRSAYAGLNTSISDPDGALTNPDPSIVRTLSFYFPDSVMSDGVWAGTHPDLGDRFGVLTGDPTQDPLGNTDDVAFETISTLFKRLVARFVISNLASGNDGLFKMRIKGLMDERALQRSETWDFVVDASLSADSVFFQAFMDALTYLRQLAETDVIHFKLDSDGSVDLLKRYFSIAISKFDISVLPSSHPSSIYETALLVRNSIMMQGAEDVLKRFDVWALSDKDLAKDGASQVFDPINDRYYNYFYTEPKGANWLDLPRSFPLPVYYYGLRRRVEVRHFFKDEIPSRFQLDTQLGEFLARHPKFSSLTSLGLNSLFIREGSGELSVFMSIDDVANRLGLPRPLAENLWNNALRCTEEGFRYIYTYVGPLYTLVEVPEKYVPFRRYDKVIGNRLMMTAFIPEPYELQRSYDGWFGFEVPNLGSSTQSRPAKTVTSGNPTLGLVKKYAATQDPKFTGVQSN